jgi:hypothetical protein
VRRFLVFCVPFVSVLGAIGACGSRTGLDAPESVAPQDAGADHPVLHDAGHEAEAAVEAEADAPHDASFRDVPVIDICPDAGSTLIYVLTAQNDLYSFYPPTLTFTLIGTIACPGTGSASPFSMAVDRRGIAYSVFTDGTLFRVDTASAACLSTTFAPGVPPFSTFGMGYVANTGDAGETLYIADAVVTGGKQNSKGLGFIDTTTYIATFVGPFSQTIPGPELTGTSDGRLFAFYTNAAGSGSHIIEVDKSTVTITQDYALTVGSPLDAYAFAFWGGSFWVFTSPGGAGSPSTVTQFTPTSGVEANVALMPQTIVGAGVSTCAPE